MFLKWVKSSDLKSHLILRSSLSLTVFWSSVKDFNCLIYYFYVQNVAVYVSSRESSFLYSKLRQRLQIFTFPTRITKAKFAKQCSEKSSFPKSQFPQNFLRARGGNGRPEFFTKLFLRFFSRFTSTWPKTFRFTRRAGPDGKTQSDITSRSMTASKR